MRALCNVPRNMDDDMLKALARRTAWCGSSAFELHQDAEARLSGTRGSPDCPSCRVRPAGAGTSPGLWRARQSARQFQPLSQPCPADRRADATAAKLADINTRMPADPPATVKDFVNHIDYVVKLIGIDHVGISSDFDGGGGLSDWRDASETFNVTLELVRRGHTEEQIGGSGAATCFA